MSVVPNAQVIPGPALSAFYKQLLPKRLVLPLRRNSTTHHAAPATMYYTVILTPVVL